MLITLLRNHFKPPERRGMKRRSPGELPSASGGQGTSRSFPQGDLNLAAQGALNLVSRGASNYLAAQGASNSVAEELPATDATPRRASRLRQLMEQEGRTHGTLAGIVGQVGKIIQMNFQQLRRDNCTNIL